MHNVYVISIPNAMKRSVYNTYPNTHEGEKMTKET